MQKYDCGFTKDNRWFRYRVAAIIIENEHILFVSNKYENYYYSVGGGIHMGETAKEAIVREVYEETGIHYQIDRLAFIHENFFHGDGTLDGKECHELAFYFLMKSRGTQKLSSNSYNSQGIKEELCWIPLNELEKYRAYPIFFNEKLKNIQKGIQHIVTHEY